MPQFQVPVTPIGAPPPGPLHQNWLDQLVGFYAQRTGVDLIGAGIDAAT